MRAVICGRNLPFLLLLVFRLFLKSRHGPVIAGGRYHCSAPSAGPAQRCPEAPSDGLAADMTSTQAVRYFLPVREEWLALRQEQILEPDSPIVDAHHHL